MSASTKAMQKQVEETQVRAATEIQVGPPRSNTNSRFPACPSVSPPALPAVAIVLQFIRQQTSVEADSLTAHNRLIARQRDDDLAMLKVNECVEASFVFAHSHIQQNKQ